MFTTEMDRRRFLKTAGALSAAGGLFLNGYNVFAGDKNIKKINVVPYMTGIVALQYLFNEAGIKDKVGTAAANKYFTVGFGKNSPRKIYEATNDEIVFLSDQLNWNEKEDKRFKYRTLVDRDPTKIDYIFPGDNLILDVGKMPAAYRDAIIKRFAGENIDVSKESLENFVDGSDPHKELVERQKEFVAEVDISKQRKDRYMGMPNLEYIARMINFNVGDTIYSGLSEQGVAFSNPEDYQLLAEGLKKKVADDKKKGDEEGKKDEENKKKDYKKITNNAVGGYNKGDDVTGPLHYLALVFRRPKWVMDKFDYLHEIGNYGITPTDKDDGEKGIGNVLDFQIKADKEEIIKIVGEDNYNKALARSVAVRTRTNNKREKYFGKIEYDKVWGISKDTANMLSALEKMTFVIDTAKGINKKFSMIDNSGNTVLESPMGPFYSELIKNKYEMLGVWMQIVDPKK